MKGRIDHEDRNKLNNKRNNLREATYSQNNANSIRKLNLTQYQGVYKNYNKFIAQISNNNKIIYLGRFKTKEEAFSKYKEEHIKIFGKFFIYFEK